MRTRTSRLGGGLRPPSDGRRAPLGALLPASPQDRLRGRSGGSNRTELPASSQLLQVHVQPKARRNEIVEQPDGSFRVRVAAVPEGGAANRAVVALLAEALDVAPSRLALVRGATSRDKLFRVEPSPGRR